MTKQLLLCICMFFIATLSFAQYSFTNSTDTYKTLLSGDTISKSIPNWDDEEFRVGIGFAFKAFGVDYDSLLVETNGSVLLYNTLASGGLQNSSASLPAFMVYGEMLTAACKNDLIYRPEGSPIIYELSGTVGSRIAKIEWVNVGLKYVADQINNPDYINFQVWLYEGTNVVEYRYGPWNVNLLSYNGNNGPTVGFGEYKGQSGTLSSDQYLKGTSNNCSLTNQYFQLTGTPGGVRVYRFTPSSISGIKDYDEKKYNILLTPNPANENTTVRFNSTEATQITISDLLGNVVMTEKITTIGKIQKEINTEQLNAGVYFISVIGSSQSAKATKRLVIQ